MTIPGEQLLAEVAGFRRRLWLQRTARLAWRALLVSLGVLVIVELAAHWLHVELAWVLALTPLIALLGAFTWSGARRPSLMRAARATDRRLQLREQLATALELELQQRELTPVARLQVAHAVIAATAGRQRTPEPVARWILTLGGCVCAAATLSLIALQADTWLDRLARAPASSHDTSVPVAAPQPIDDDDAPTGSLQQLVRPLGDDAVPTPEQLASTEQALADRTAASRSTQEALGTLANALRQVSAGQAAADALNSGDYGGAVADIAQLGQESDQLSPTARQLLSAALLNAADASQASPLLADRERRAAQALKFNSYGPTAQSLQNLASSVDKASQSVLSQAELSAAWQELQAAKERAANASNPAGAAPAGVPASARVAGDSGAAQAAAGDVGGRAETGAAGTGSASGGFTSDAPSRLNAAGVPVEVPLQISAAPSRQTQAPDGTPASVQIVSDTAPVGGTAPTSTSGLDTVRAERNSVPADLQPVVRDYFTTP
jgi:hypothetical protein